MDIIRITAIGLVGAVLVIAVQQQKKELAVALSIAVGALILLQCADQLAAVIDGVLQIAEQSGLTRSNLKLLMKLLAASYTVEFGSEICKDAGQQSLAMKIQLGGKLVMAGMALPVLTSLLELITELMP